MTMGKGGHKTRRPTRTNLPTRKIRPRQRAHRRGRKRSTKALVKQSKPTILLNGRERV